MFTVAVGKGQELWPEISEQRTVVVVSFVFVQLLGGILNGLAPFPWSILLLYLRSITDLAVYPMKHVSGTRLMEGTLPPFFFFFFFSFLPRDDLGVWYSIVPPIVTFLEYIFSCLENKLYRKKY